MKNYERKAARLELLAKLLAADPTLGPKDLLHAAMAAGLATEAGARVIREDLDELRQNGTITAECGTGLITIGLGEDAVQVSRERYDRLMAIRAIVEESTIDGATNTRFAYYKAVTQHLVPKTPAGYDAVQRDVLLLRRIGESDPDRGLKWAQITDVGRAANYPCTHADPAAALRELAITYQSNPWHGGEKLALVFCESSSAASIVSMTCRDWRVALIACRGQASDSFAWSLAKDLKDKYGDKMPEIHCSYIGDLDPAGLSIESQIHAKFSRFLGQDVAWERLSVRLEDVPSLQGLGTPVKCGTKGCKSKTGCSHRKSWTDADGENHPFGEEAYEVEAVDAPVLRARLKDWLAGTLDANLLRRAEVKDEGDRVWIAAWADPIGNGDVLKRSTLRRGYKQVTADRPMPADRADPALGLVAAIGDALAEGADLDEIVEIARQRMTSYVRQYEEIAHYENETDWSCLNWDQPTRNDAL